MKLKLFCRLLRTEQWYKNSLVLLATFFSFNLFNFKLYPLLATGLVLTCLISSANYILNDIRDVERDRQHPEKRLRPIPSGDVSIKTAATLAVMLSILSLTAAFYVNVRFAVVLLTFFVLCQLYSFYLKDIVLVDVFVIAVNYVLRAIAGAFLINVPVSSWLIMGVYFTALLLAFGKRKNELMLLGDRAELHKGVFKHYTDELLKYAISMSSALVLMTYALYTMGSPVGDLRLILTMPPVAFIVTRYAFLLYNTNPATRNPNELVKDKIILIVFVVLITMLICLLYLAPHYPFG